MNSKRDQNIEMSENDQISGTGHLLDKENQSEIHISKKKMEMHIISIIYYSTNRR